MGLEPTQKTWLSDVLGVKSGTGAKVDPMPLWAAARTEALGRLGKLVKELENYDDEQAEYIASYPMTTLMDRIEAPIVAVLKGLAAMDADVAKAMVEEQREELEESELLDMLDNNPFGVKVDVAEVLIGTLEEIESRLGVGD